MALTNLSQITTSGIATGTDLNIHNITGAAATFTGNVTVGGTLTYEDVTNIDSVGIITARSGINVNTGDVNITSGNLALASATPMVVASNGSGHLRLGAGGSEKVRITSSGLVGIGETSPSSKFEIVSGNTAGIATGIKLKNDSTSASGPGSSIDFVVDGVNDVTTAQIIGQRTSANYHQGSLQFLTKDSAGGGLLERLRITSAGRIGIGTDNPEEELSIQLDSSSDGPTLRLRNANGGDGTYLGRIQTGDAAGTFFAGINFLKHDSNDGEIRLRTKVAGSNTDVVTIVDGNVGVGLVNPTQKLTIAGNTQVENATFKVVAASPNIILSVPGGGIDSRIYNDGSGNFNIGHGANSDTPPAKLSITTAGNVGIGSTIPTDILDIQTGSSDEVTKFKVKTGGQLELTRNHTSAPYIKTLMGSGNPSIHLGDSSGDNTVIHGDGSSYFNGGSVGIGTNNPTSDLQVVSYGDHGKIRVESSGNGNRAGIEFFRESSAGTGKGAAGIWVESETGNSTGELRFGTANNASLQSFNTKMILDVNGRIGIGTDVPTSDLHVFKSTAASSIIDAAAGDALLTLRNAGNTNWSGINFTRERSTGTNVTGGSIWMPSDTSNTSATLYIQAQSASAGAGQSGALTDDNGVRLKLASGFGANSALSVEVGSTEKFSVDADGESKFTVGTNKFVKFYAAAHNDEGNLGAGLAFSRPSDGADMLSGMFSHSNTGLGIAARDHVTILTGGTSNVSDTEERVRITSNGAVGIGTNSPDDRLHVLGGNIQIGKTEETGYETIIGNNVLRFNRSAASYIDQAGTGDIRFRYGANDETWMHMEGSNGSIGIGTDNVDHRLEVFGPPGTGDLSIKSAASAAGGTEHSKLRFRVRNPSNQESTLASIHVKSDANWGGNLLFGTKTASGGLSESTVERVRIKHDGNVGIGTQAYGDIDPLAPLHVSSYAPTTAITDHQHLRNAAQILCQTSNNVNNSRSGIMFSGALHSTDGCSAGIIANHENVAENSETTSLSFYTSHNEVIGERFRIFADGQFHTNGVRNIYETFRLYNNQTYNWDYTVPDEGGYGNSFYLVAGYNHYYTTNYGAHRTVWFSSRGTSVGLMGNGIEQYHSQSGSWTFSKPNATTVRITKTSGTYTGQGYGFIHLMYNHF